MNIRKCLLKKANFLREFSRKKQSAIKLKRILRSFHRNFFFSLCGVGIFLLLIFWGIFLRWNAISVASLWMDEGYSFLAADTFRKTLGITLETGFKYGKNSMLFHALQAGSMSLFGISEWALRLPSFLFGVLLILLSFFGMRKLFPKSILPFVFAVAIAFSSWEIVWSIQGRMYQMLQTLFLVSLFFLWRSFSDARMLFPFFFFSLCASFTHPFGSILFPLFFLVLGIRRGNSFFLPPFFAVYRRWVQLTLFFFLILLFLFWKFDLIMFLVRDGLSLSLFYHLRFLWEQHSVVLISATISSIFLLWSGERRNRYFLLFLVVAFLIPFLVIGLFISAVNYRYLFPLFPILLLLGFLWIPVVEKSQGIIITMMCVVAQFGFLAPEWILAPNAPYALEADMPRAGYRFYTPQPDFRTAFHFLTERKKPNEIFITPYPEISYFYGLETDIVLLFDWNRKAKNWEDVERAQYMNRPHITSQKEFEKILRSQSGYVLLDSFALERIPLESAGFLEANTERISPFSGEEGVTNDSRLLLFHFPVSQQ